MSGHSKWATIKRKKAATDQARGQAVLQVHQGDHDRRAHGGGDPEANPRLRTAIGGGQVGQHARLQHRARRQARHRRDRGRRLRRDPATKATGPAASRCWSKCATDNRNRTAGDIRHIFTKFGGSLGEAGSVAYLFKPRGVIVVEKSRDRRGCPDRARARGRGRRRQHRGRQLRGAHPAGRSSRR